MSADEDAVMRLSKRLSEGLDAQNTRIDFNFASLRTQIDEMLAEVRRGRAETRAQLEVQDKASDIAFAALENGLGELRDRVTHLEHTTLPAAAAKAAASMAEGAAKGAGEAAGIVAAATAKVTAAQLGKGFFATWLGKLVAVCVAFTAVVTAVGYTPSALRGVERFWHFVAEAKK